MKDRPLIHRILKRILIFDTSHPFVVIGTALFLSAAAIFYTIMNLDFYTDQRDLISPENRLVKLSKHIDQFDRLDNFIVTIENKDKKRSILFLKALVKRLAKDKGMYEEIFYRVDPADFSPWFLLYLDRQKLIEIKENLYNHQEFIRAVTATPTLVNLFRQINREISSKLVGSLFTGFLEETPPSPGKGEMDLTFLVDLLQELSLSIKEDKKTLHSPWSSFIARASMDDEGYFWTAGKKYLLVFVTPERREGFIATAHSLNALRNAIIEVKKDFPDIEVGVTGQEAMNMDEMTVALHDMSIATVLSISGLVLLLTLFWRGIRRPLLEMTELLVALSLTTGLTTLIIGHLNILSITFAPLLLGLGIDYGIHWLARYQEEEGSRHYPKGRAIRSAMNKMGPSIMLAGITAAMSFFPLILTGFRGLVELGIITFMGMIMTTITTLVLLPALVMVFDKSRHTHPMEPSPIDAEIKILFTLDNRRSTFILITGIALAIVSVWGAMGVKFDLNILHLQSKTAESVKWENKLIKDSKRSSMYGAVMAKTLDDVKRKTIALERLDTVSEVHSILSLLPKDQEEKIPVIKEIFPLVSSLKVKHLPDKPVDINALIDVLHRIRSKMAEGANQGTGEPLKSQMSRAKDLIDNLSNDLLKGNRKDTRKKLARFQAALFKDLDKKLETLKEQIAHVRPMTPKDLPEALRRRFISNDGRFLLRIFPNGDIWEPSFLGKFVHDLKRVDKDVIGDPITLYVFTKAFKDACIKAAFYGVFCIFIILMVTSKSLQNTIFKMIPLLMGTLWTLGLMRIFKIDLNLANSLFLPLIVGAGVEYGIVIIERWRQMDRKETKLSLPFSTAKGVILAGLTTTVGFGSLIISDHQGIKSLGLLAVFGSLCILVAAILFLPAVLQQIKRNQGA